MEIKLNKYHKDTIKEVATSYGVNAEKLEEFYMDIMRNNFFDDLCDIARENRDELKGE